MSDDLPDPEVTRLLHRASLPRDLGTSLSLSKSTAGNDDQRRDLKVCVPSTLGPRVSTTTEATEDRVSEDGLTDVRAYARVNEVSGTYS